MVLMSLKKKYEQFILENAESVGHIESLVRASLFLVPGRFKDSELTTEFAYTGVSLLSLYHDVINAKNLLRRGISETNSGEAVPPPYSLSTAKWISFFQSVELLLEIASTHTFGEKGKWPTVFVIELIKSILRFKLLFKTNGNIIIHQHIPSRDNTALPTSNTFSNIEKKYVEKPTTATSEHNKLSSSPTGGKKIRKTLLDFQEEEKKKMAAFSSTNTLMSLLPPPPPPPPDMVRRLIGESLYILRPLIYLAAMYFYGKKSWRPWLLSLSSDVTSWWCLYYSPSKLSIVEKEEVKRRSIGWLYYCVRSPFFERFIGEGFAVNLAQKLQCVPLLRVFFGTLLDYLLVYRSHYFYTSAS